MYRNRTAFSVVVLGIDQQNLHIGIIFFLDMCVYLKQLETILERRSRWLLKSPKLVHKTIKNNLMGESSQSSFIASMYFLLPLFHPRHMEDRGDTPGKCPLCSRTLAPWPHHCGEILGKVGQDSWTGYAALRSSHLPHSHILQGSCKQPVGVL